MRDSQMTVSMMMMMMVMINALASDGCGGEVAMMNGQCKIGQNKQCYDNGGGDDDDDEQMHQYQTKVERWTK